ncbi:MAG TPA: hypothetical protein VG621_03525 [Candidatus Paceibacterota bacterium]|nr:hypothetical protein [Candidatus Paceibacterota bacterium]
MGNFQFLSLLGITVLLAVFVFIQLFNLKKRHAHKSFMTYLKENVVKFPVSFSECMVSYNTLCLREQKNWGRKNKFDLVFYDLKKELLTHTLTELRNIPRFIYTFYKVSEDGSTKTVRSNDRENKYSFMKQWDDFESNITQKALQEVGFIDAIFIHSTKLLNMDFEYLFKKKENLYQIDNTINSIRHWIAGGDLKSRVSKSRLEYGTALDTLLNSKKNDVARKFMDEMHRIENTTKTGDRGIHIVKKFEQLMQLSLFKWEPFTKTKEYVELCNRYDFFLEKIFQVTENFDEKMEIIGKLKSHTVKEKLMNVASIVH